MHTIHLWLYIKLGFTFSMIQLIKKTCKCSVPLAKNRLEEKCAITILLNQIRVFDWTHTDKGWGVKGIQMNLF